MQFTVLKTAVELLNIKWSFHQKEYKVKKFQPLNGPVFNKKADY
jgi:hypothetical protein